MAQFKWSQDVGSGVLKERFLSEKIYEAAFEDTKVFPFCVPVEGYGKNMGQSVTIERLAQISEPTSAVLTEGVKIPEDSYSISSTSITPVELGRSLPFTSLAEDLLNFNLENKVQKALRTQLALVLDSIAAASMTGTDVKLKYVPTGLTSRNLATNGTAATAATVNLNLWHVADIYDTLYDTYQVPPYEGDNYMGIFRHLALRGLMNDPDWVEWHKYTTPANKATGEVGMIENIRFIGTNHANAFGKIGTGSVLGEGVVFGDDFCAVAEILTPELRVKIPGDYDRDRGVAWYGILNTGIIWNTANAGEVKGLHVTST